MDALKQQQQTSFDKTPNYFSAFYTATIGARGIWVVFFVLFFNSNPHSILYINDHIICGERNVYENSVSYDDYYCFELYNNRFTKDIIII